jgi:hypothetical protein
LDPLQAGNERPDAFTLCGSDLYSRLNGCLPDLYSRLDTFRKKLSQHVRTPKTTPTSTVDAEADPGGTPLTGKRTRPRLRLLGVKPRGSDLESDADDLGSVPSPPALKSRIGRSR